MNVQWPDPRAAGEWKQWADRLLTALQVALSDQSEGPSVIPSGSIVDAMLADMPPSTVKGRASGSGTGVPVNLIGSQLGAIISDIPTAALIDLAVTLAKIADGAVSLAKIADAAVSNAKLANMAEALIKGRIAGSGTGAPVDLTAAQVRTIIAALTGPGSAIVNQMLLFDSTAAPYVVKAGKRFLLANETFWIREGGTGLNLGSAKGADAFGDWMPAVNHVDNNIHGNGFDVTFAWDDTASAPDTFSSAATAIISLNKPLSGGGTRIFQGSAGADDDVRLKTTGVSPNPTSPVIQFNGDIGPVLFTNKFWIESAGSNSIDNRSNNGFVNNGGTLYFPGAGAPAHMQQSQAWSYFANNGTIKFDNDAEIFIRNDSGTFHDNGTITFLGARTATGAFWRGDFFSNGYLGSNVTGSFTGPRVDLRMGGKLNLFGPIGTSGTPTRGSAQEGCILTNLGITENMMVGSATFGGGTTVAVDFTSAGFVDQFNTNYQVMTGGGDPARTYVVKPADRTTTGFTITADAANSHTVWWSMKWLP